MRIPNLSRLLVIVGIAGTLTAGASASIVVDFETDTSADWTIQTSDPVDSTYDFQFDYIAAGIPLAPRSTAGDLYGLRFTANDTSGIPADPAAQEDHITAFHNTPMTGNIELLVDVYMAVTGTGGTTEYAHIGVGSDGSTFNSLFTPISGRGSFVAFTGDGGSSSSDYRWFRQEDTTLPTSDPSYLAGSGANTAALYQSIYPGTDGSPTNIWTTVRVTVDAGTDTITYALDGTDIILGTTAFTDGLVSLGYADVFDSVAAPFQSQYVVYDNLEVIPEPMALALLAMGVLALRRR